jgi:hypothetical protein
MNRQFNIRHINLVLLVFLMFLFPPVLVLAQPADFPTDWSYWMSDPDENGTSNDYRDVQAIYYQVDTEYLYLRLQNRCDCGWGPNDHGRYKWFIDTIDGDANLQGGTFHDFEFLMMLEDHIDNNEDPAQHDHSKAEHDFLGELYFLDDLGNDGVDVRWSSGNQPHPYMVNTPVGSPSPSTSWQRELGVGTGGFGGQQEVFGPEVGFRMEGPYVDMYVSRQVLGNPTQVCMYWATDQENQNLDQAPHQDRPTAELCFEIPLVGNITINKHVEPDLDTTASFPFGGDFGTFNLDVVNGDEANITFSDVSPGSYNVFEDLGSLSASFTLASIVCDDPSLDSTVDLATGDAFIELSSGEDVSCSFTNVESPVENGTIVIVKHSLPHDPQEFEFTSDVPGFANFSLSDTGDTHTITMTDIAPGNYTVTEAALPDGWHLDGLLCVDPDGESIPSTTTITDTATIDLDSGEVVTCTFRNGLDATISVMKQTNPTGSVEQFDFSGDLDEFTLSDGETIVFGGLDQDEGDEYAVSETNLPDGWLLQEISCEDPSGGTAIDLGTGTVTLEIDHGDNISCTFINSAPGTLIIYKDSASVDAIPFLFTDGFDEFIVTQGNPFVFTDLAPSVMTITEFVNAEWVLEGIVCNDPDGETVVDLESHTVFADVDAGETVECTFYNTYSEMPIPVDARWALLLLAFAVFGIGCYRLWPRMTRS